jgi:CubicO group peptidase (beta-lactamase class C family)
MFSTRKAVMPDTATTLAPAQIDRISKTIESDIANGAYHGAVLSIRLHGETVIETALGAREPQGRRLEIDDIFRVLSLTKLFTNVLVLRCIGRGELAFNTPVAEVIPEFLGTDRFRAAKKDQVTVAHLLNHTAGLPSTPTPLPYERIGVLSDVIRAIGGMDVVASPGEQLIYSPAINHALLGEIVRRVHGAARFRDVLVRELVEPLGLTSTQLGNPEGRDVVPLVANFRSEAWLSAADIEILNEVIDGDAELPWVGVTTSVRDVMTVAEALRRSAAAEGSDPIVSPSVLDKAIRNTTGEQPNDLFRRVAESRRWEIRPGYLGLGFPLAGEGTGPNMFGTLTSARTFGAFGAGSTLMWVDPARQLSFVCLTAGVMAEDANILRFQRLSDMTVAGIEGSR